MAIFAGAGVEGAHDEVIALAEAVNAPIGHSLRGKDFMQYDNPYDIGMTGLLGYGAAAEGIEDADLLILLGTDFPYDQFLPGTRTAQVDRAAQKLGRRTDVDVAVHGDVLPTLAALMPLIQPKKSRRFLDAMLKKARPADEQGRRRLHTQSGDQRADPPRIRGVGAGPGGGRKTRSSPRTRACAMSGPPGTSIRWEPAG